MRKLIKKEKTQNILKCAGLFPRVSNHSDAKSSSNSHSVVNVLIGVKTKLVDSVTISAVLKNGIKLNFVRKLSKNKNFAPRVNR